MRLSHSWLLLAGLLYACGASITAIQDPGLGCEGEGYGEAESPGEAEADAEAESPGEAEAEAEAESPGEAEAEAEAEAESPGEAEAEAEAESPGEAEAEAEAESPGEAEAEAEAESPGEAEAEAEAEGEVEEGAENDSEISDSQAPEVVQDVSTKTIVKEVEFGMCTVTCGIGVRKVILTNGCPEGESKCIVRIEECRGPVDCGWSKPLSESLESARLACVHVFPANRFKYVWKLLRPDQQPVVLANDSAVLEVRRDVYPMAFECETLENGETIATIKFTIYTTNGLQMRRSNRPDTNAVFFCVLSIGVICVFVIFILLFILINWVAVKSFWGGQKPVPLRYIRS